METKKENEVVAADASRSADGTSTINPAEKPAATKPGEAEKTVALTPEQLQEIKDKAQKEARDRYLPQINKKAAELKAAKEELEKVIGGRVDPNLLKALAEITRINQQEEELEKEISNESNTFFAANADLSDEEKSEITATKEAISNISWDTARKLYFAEKDPTRLIKKEAKKVEEDKPNGTLPFGTKKPNNGGSAGEDNKKELSEDERSAINLALIKSFNNQ